MLKKFEGEKRKQYIALGVAVIVLGGGILLLSALFSSDKKTQTQQAVPPKIQVPEPKKIEEESFKKEYGERLLELEKRLQALERKDTLSSPPINPPSSPITPPPPPPPAPPPAPPPPPSEGSEGSQSRSSSPPPKPQVMTDLIALEKVEKPQATAREQAQAQQAEQKLRPKGMRIPAGAFVKGVILSGLDAPTGGRAQSSPHPVLIRIVDKAILPNLYKADIKDCFVIGSGYGDLSSERAYIRLEVLSCVKKNGEVIERKVSGFVAGEDGKVGLAGRVVSKQGQVLARMLMAGFIEGISRIFQQSGTTVIVSPTGGTTTQAIDPTKVFQTGISGGIASATKELVEFYKKLAEETYPVVEINAGRNVDLVFLQGIDFSDQQTNGQSIREEEQGILRTNRRAEE
ncbi:MAG: TraB/VirB10 family protein [Aquificaceae bacterium]